ncbi:MAG: hypothetical protein R3B47_20145 [Bacteroidia bacterium]
MEPIPFSQHKEKLFQALFGGNSEINFLAITNELSQQGNSKKAIYELFLEFLQEIQNDPGTKVSETAYDTLADFLDGFSAWGGRFRILPDEPDV